MKTAVTERLTLAYLRRLDRYTYFATAVAALMILLGMLWMLFHIGGIPTTGIVINAIYPISTLLGAFWSCHTAYRGRYGPLRLEPRHQLAWLLIGLGFLASALGGTYYFYLDILGHCTFPSYSDIGFTLRYPLTFVGLLLMPATTRFRLRMGLDTLIAVLGLLGIGWTFIIGPAYFSKVVQAVSPFKLFTLFTALSYPCWDIVLVLAVVILIQRRTQLVTYPSLILFGVGILINTLTDSSYAFMNIFTKMYQPGVSFTDSLWLVGNFLIGLSALYQYNALARRSYNEYVQTHKAKPHMTETLELSNAGTYSRGWSLSSLSVYVPLTILLGLMVYYETFHDGPVAHLLVLLSALTGVLITARYLLATRENEGLLQEREQQRKESELLRRLNIELTATLDINLLLECIVTQAVTELQFDAAMLLIKDERHRSLDAQSYILMHTAHSNTADRPHRRFQGESAFYRTILVGKIVEVNWADHRQELLDASIWPPEWQVSTMLFLPLLYQGHILGSLGIARRAKQHLHQQEVAMMHVYTEQVATIVEHAHLYQEAHEHEQFARAMANIATRLNAAAAEPAEIHQLICTEGANALQADYALLYAPDKRGVLNPLAVFTGEHELASTPRDWPPLHPHSEEAQVLHSLQPLVLSLASTKNMIEMSQVADTILQEQKQQPFSLRAQLARHFMHTVIIAPLITGRTSVGMLLLGRSLPPGAYGKRSLDASDLSYAQDFAEQAAVAFTNARLYQHLQAAHRRLQELDQLKDQFMVTASHELRTPLTAVQGYIELIAQYHEILPPDQLTEFLQKAQRSCDELVVLLGNVMDASRLEIEAGIRPALLQDVSVLEMVESVVDLIAPLVVQEHREVNVHIPADVFVRADPLRLRQVLMNISINALKYSPAHTPISYTVHHTRDQQPSIVINIADKGKGISLQNQKHLFQRFVRLESDVNSPVRGSGLGLYISRRLIDAMGGKIWIESKGIAGEGSIFHVQLPAAE